MYLSKKEREYYNVHREKTCEWLGITQTQYNQFRRIGDELHRVYEDYCNGVFGNDAAYQAAVKPLEQKARLLARKLGLTVFFQTDPRGATIYLDRKVIEYDRYTDAAVVY